MAKVIDIAVEKTGFPVKVGGCELWFDNSIENIKRFANIDKLTEEKTKESREKAKHVHFPDDLSTAGPEVANAAFDFHKEFVAAQYDIIFGDGSFKKIYKKNPDVLALERALNPIGFAISDRIKELENERLKEVSSIKSEFTAKKAKKQK